MLQNDTSCSKGLCTQSCMKLSAQRCCSAYDGPGQILPNSFSTALSSKRAVQETQLFMLNSAFHQESVNSKSTIRGYVFSSLILLGRISVRQILFPSFLLKARVWLGTDTGLCKAVLNVSTAHLWNQEATTKDNVGIIAKLKLFYLSWSSFFSMSHLTCKAIASWAVWFIFSSTCCSAWSFRTELPRGMDSLSCTQEFRWEKFTRIDPESLICSAFSSDKSLKRKQERANFHSTIFISWLTSEACNHASGRTGKQVNVFAGDKSFIWHFGTRTHCNSWAMTLPDSQVSSLFYPQI